MDNPLFAALQSNYGDGTPPPPDTSTVRGLLEFCRMWLDGEVDTEELNNPCIAMAGRLEAGARDTEADLRQNPHMVASARAPIERVAQAYGAIAEVLERLPVLAADGDVEGYREAIEVFEQERQVVLDCNAEITRNLSGEFRLCPRCGSRGEEDICSPCGVARLYPDPRASELESRKTQVLSPLYWRVFQTYEKVTSGEAPLSALLEILELLEQRLLKVRDNYQKVLETEPAEDDDPQQVEDSKDLAHRVLSGIERIFSGMDRIRSVEETFRMADLSRGWDTIFDSAVDMQRATQRYSRAYGLHDLLSASDDSIEFSGN